MTRDDYDYFEMRARQEEQAALIAAGDAARQRHEELAEAYRLRCELIKSPLPADTSGPAVRIQGTSRREPTVSSSSSALAASPTTPARPFLRA